MSTEQPVTTLRIKRNKELLIKQLKKIPVVTIACNQISVSRATYYRWCEQDDDFKKAIDEAMTEGENFINDLSESQVISLIKEKNWPAISFWLKHHHPKYAPKIEVITNIKQEELNEEQEATVRKALELAFPVLPKQENEQSKDKQPHSDNESDTKPTESPSTTP